MTIEGARVQGRVLLGDEADAYAFWKDKEFKTFAVDLVTGQGRKRKVVHTMYVRARDAVGAVACARANDFICRKPRPYYSARLAGPRELGCTLAKPGADGHQKEAAPQLSVKS